MSLTPQMVGLHADMPATHTEGVLYSTTDTKQLYFIDGTGRTLQDFSAPDANRRDMLFHDSCAKGDAVSLRSDGKVQKATGSAGSNSDMAVLGVNSFYSPAIVKIDENKYFANGHGGEISIIKTNTDGTINSTATIDIGSTATCATAVDITHGAILYNNGDGIGRICVVTINWTTMTMTLETAGELVLATVDPHSNMGGSIDIGSGKFVFYGAVISAPYKVYCSISGTVVSGGTETALSSFTVSNLETYIKDLGDGDGIMTKIIDGNGSSVNVSKITTSEASGTSTESAPLAFSKTNDGYSFCNICSFNTNESIYFYSNGVESIECFLIGHAGGATPSRIKRIPIEFTNIIVDNIRATSQLIYVTGNIFALLYYDGTDFVYRLFEYTGGSLKQMSAESTLLVSGYLSSEFLKNVPWAHSSDGSCCSLQAVGSANIPHVMNITASDIVNYHDGFAHEAAAGGETKKVTFKGGIAESTGLTVGKRYYWDRFNTPNLNADGNGTYIGDAISTTEINTVR